MPDRYTVTTAEIATGTALKTLLEIEGAATRPRLAIDEVWVTFEGIAPTGVPIEVTLVSKTADCTGTASPPSPVPDDDAAPASGSTVRHNCTAEGTLGVIYRAMKLHPQSGVIYQMPLGKEIKRAVAGTIGVRVLAAADVGSIAHMGWLE